MSSLQYAVTEHKTHPIRRGEYGLALRQNNEIIMNVIKNICRQQMEKTPAFINHGMTHKVIQVKSSKPIYARVMEILRSLDKFDLGRTREILQQALKQPVCIYIIYIYIYI